MFKRQYRPNSTCNLLTMQEATETFNLSRNTIERLAEQCGAKLKIGRTARYKKDVLQEHIDSFSGV